jgi:hypothetical protein
MLEYKLNSRHVKKLKNINGTVNIDTFEVEVDFTNSINSESMKRLMEQLSRGHPDGVVYMILDNTKYCHSK